MQNDGIHKQGLFKQTVLRKFVKNSFWLSFAQGINGLANFLIIVYLARRFGPVISGTFSYAMAFVMLFAALFDMGLSTVITKKFAENVVHEKDFLLLLFLKLGLGLISVTLINLIAYAMGKNVVMLKVILCLSLSQFFIQLLNLFYALFRARQKMEHEASIRLFYILSLLIGIFFLLQMHPTIFLVSLIYAFVGLVVVCATLFVLRHLMIWDKTIWHFDACKKYLRMGVYLALAQGVGDIMTNTDTFLLGYWNMLEQAGFYTAAAKVNAMILFPMSITTTAIFPILVKSFGVSPQKFQQYWKVWMEYTVCLAFLSVFLVIVFAKDIVLLIYTPDYLPAVSALRVLMVTAMIVYINNMYSHALVIHEQQKLILYATIAGCILNVVMNLFLIPKWGIEGSSLATAISQLTYGVICMLSLAWKNDFKRLEYQLMNRLVIAAVSAVVAWFAVKNIRIHWLQSLLCMTVIYLSIHVVLIKSQKIISKLNKEGKRYATG